jgi:hypothetical protein
MLQFPQNILPEYGDTAEETLKKVLAALNFIYGELGGGGGATNTTVVGPLGPQAAAQSVATVISGTTANGNTTSTTTNRTSEGPITIAAGALSIEFLISSDFVGTINGATVNNTTSLVVGVYRLDAPPWKPLGAFVYTITAGSAIRTIQT